MGINKTVVVYVDQEMKVGEEICTKDGNGDIGYDEFPGIGFSGHIDLDVAGTICVNR